MKTLITCSIALALLVVLPALKSAESLKKNGWVSLFDGKSLAGWKISTEHPETFSVKDGEIVVHGERAHLFYDGAVNNHNFKNYEFKAMVMTKPGANSGMFISTQYQESGWPSAGYEIQVNNSHTDWRRTGSVYAKQDVKETFVKDNEWYTEHIIVQGRKITVKINDKVINEYTEPEGEPSKLGSGTVALQGHDPKSEVHYKDVMIKVLPD